ncbi:MAG: F0F1 ATP synthase subunit alpha, partial [Candidatus Acidiferrales bacterium]
EILKQDQYQPLPIERQVLILFAGGNRYLDDIPVAECRRFEAEMYSFVETHYGGVFKALREKKAFDDAVRAEATKALDAFKETFMGSLSAAGAAAAD